MGTNQRAQIVMSEAEIADFVANSRTGTLATIGADGQPHLTAMWYARGRRRDLAGDQGQVAEGGQPQARSAGQLLIEDGDTYDTLRGVSFEGVAEIVDDPDAIFIVSASVCGSATPAPTPTR